MIVVLGGGIWWWSIAVNIAPYLLIGGATLGNVGLVSVTQDIEQSLQRPSDDKQPVPQKIDGNWRTVSRKFNQNELVWIANAPEEEIMERYKVSYETAHNWIGYAKRDYQKLYGEQQ
jgi:hypothetical protein